MNQPKKPAAPAPKTSTNPNAGKTPAAGASSKPAAKPTAPKK